MTRNEFSNWLNELKNTFPAVRQFFSREDPDDTANLATRWLDVLHKVDAETADRAIQALLSGDIDVPKYLSDWATLPATVRRWCRDNKPLPTLTPTYSDERTYRCPICLDRGFGVEVFNWRWVRHMSVEIEQRSLPTNWREARQWCKGKGGLVYSVDCNCETGRRQAEQRRVHRETFNTKLHCPVPGGGPSVWSDALADWIAKHPVLDANAWDGT